MIKIATYILAAIFYPVVVVVCVEFIHWRRKSLKEIRFMRKSMGRSDDLTMLSKMLVYTQRCHDEIMYAIRCYEEIRGCNYRSFERDGKR